MIVTKRHDRIVEIAIANPPVNALGDAVRRALCHAIAQADADGEVDAIVITGQGALFSAGADITEFGKAPVLPLLPETIDIIEACTKPVVAAINGLALGGGLELALGCHYRVAAETAAMGLPEVKLGLLPGAGGTQRLPRLTGVGPALECIIRGEPVAAPDALKLGLIDRIAPVGHAVEVAVDLAASVTGPRRCRDMSITAADGAIDTFARDNARLIAGLDAPAACLQAVRAAVTLPFEEGLQEEAALFEALEAGAQSKGLRHAFFAERAAAKVDGLPSGTRGRAINTIGIVGAGTMGVGISMNFLSAGIPVTLFELSGDALSRGLATIDSTFAGAASKGRITHQHYQASMAALSSTLDLAALADCDLIIEAAYENMDVKKAIFRDLDRIAKPGAILATNTSFLNVDEIAAVTSRPHDVLGLHFFSPANIMKLVEVVRGAQTAPDVVATGMALARKVGKVPVVAGVCYGFIGNRMLAVRQEQAYALLLEGATPAQIDKVHIDIGLPMGPFRMMDLAGCDIGWHRDPARVDTVLEALCAVGRFGQKAGAGFYDYDATRKATESPVVADCVEQVRARRGIAVRPVGDDEILVRTVYTMINEAALILEGGFAQRASDIDVVWLSGYGWPRHTGGPLFWAHQVGLARIVSALADYSAQLGAEFQLSALLVKNAEASVPLERA